MIVSCEAFLTFLHHTDQRLCSQILDIENKIELGQIEEVIEIAKEELELVEFYFGKECRIIILLCSLCLLAAKANSVSLRQRLTLHSIFILNSSAEKGWELVAAAKEEADFMKKEMADTLYFTDPKNHPLSQP